MNNLGLTQKKKQENKNSPILLLFKVLAWAEMKLTYKNTKTRTIQLRNPIKHPSK